MALLLARATAGQVSLSGHADAAADLDGTLDVARALSGASPAAASATGTLATARPLAGTGSAANGATGALGITKGLSAHADAAAGFTGDAAVARALAGDASAAAWAAGDLTVTGGGVARDLAGTISAAAWAVGDLSVAGPFNVFSQLYDSHEGAVDFHLEALAGAAVLAAAEAGAVTYGPEEELLGDVDDSPSTPGGISKRSILLAGGIT